MNDSSLSPTPADATRRKQVAMILAGSFFVLLSLAFMFGGNPTPVTKGTEKDTPVFVIDDVPPYQPDDPDVPKDWLNTPEGTLADSDTSTAPTPGKQESPVVAGDAPAAHLTETQSAQSTQAQTASTPASLASGRLAEPDAAKQGTAAAASGTVTSAQPKQEAPPHPAAPKEQASGTQAASSSALAAKPASGTMAAAGTTPQKTPSQSKKPQHAAPPVFVRPKVKQPGFIAQTHKLITHEEMAAAASRSAPAATPPPNPKTKSAPAHVLQAEARTYAEQTTAAFRQQGALSPTQRVRLPRSTETTSKKIWRDDDKPATADERRPFGLVVVDETPEGIPLRTDIPAGTSALEKTGADKPLWKRPE